MHQPPHTYNPESPFKVRRAEAQGTAPSSSCRLKEHNSHFSCDAGLLGSEMIRERKLKVEESSSNCSNQGPERASTTYESQLQLGLYPSPAEKSQELAIMVSVVHKQSLAPLSNWHKRLLGDCFGLCSPAGARLGQSPSSVSKSAQLENTG